MERFACRLALLGALLMGIGCQRASAKTDGSSAPASVAKAPLEAGTAAPKVPASTAAGDAMGGHHGRSRLPSEEAPDAARPARRRKRREADPSLAHGLDRPASVPRT